MPVISTNTAANTALRYLNQNSADQSSALAKLASGSKITKASDDAAGLAIGTQLSTNVAALTQASTNASQATSILQIADGGLASISDVLTRMTALATEAASGNVTDTQRSQDINTEYQALASEINSIASSTRYAGNSVLDSTSSFSATTSFIIGTASSDSIAFSLGVVSASGLGLSSSALTSASGAQAAMALLTTAVGSITQERAQVGAYESQFNFSSEGISTNTENVSAAKSAVLDADVAAEKSDLSSADVKSQASIAALSQAAKMPQELLSLLQS
jgi:flagellin